jgi:hypothetical protein
MWPRDLITLFSLNSLPVSFCSLEEEESDRRSGREIREISISLSFSPLFTALFCTPYWRARAGNKWEISANKVARERPTAGASGLAGRNAGAQAPSPVRTGRGAAVVCRGANGCQVRTSADIRRRLGTWSDRRWRRGCGNESPKAAEFVLRKKKRHVGPRAVRAGPLGRSYAPAAPVTTGANVGVRGREKAAAGRGDIRLPQETCGTVPHGIALPTF